MVGRSRVVSFTSWSRPIVAHTYHGAVCADADDVGSKGSSSGDVEENHKRSFIADPVVLGICTVLVTYMYNA
jgi:hypothetical protein